MYKQVLQIDDIYIGLHAKTWDPKVVLHCMCTL